MADRELGKTVRDQIGNILNEAFGDEDKLKEPSERERGYDACAFLIKDGVDALKKMSAFKSGVFDNYFSDKPQDPITITVDSAEFSVQYLRSANPNSTEESLTLTRNRQAKLRIHTYKSALGSKKCDINYSEDPEDFKIERYPLGDPMVFRQAYLMIKELQLASS